MHKLNCFIFSLDGQNISKMFQESTSQGTCYMRSSDDKCAASKKKQSKIPTASSQEYRNHDHGTEQPSRTEIKRKIPYKSARDISLYSKTGKRPRIEHANPNNTHCSEQEVRQSLEQKIQLDDQGYFDDSNYNELRNRRNCCRNIILKAINKDANDSNYVSLVKEDEVKEEEEDTKQIESFKHSDQVNDSNYVSLSEDEDTKEDINKKQNENEHFSKYLADSEIDPDSERQKFSIPADIKILSENEKSLPSTNLLSADDEPEKTKISEETNYSSTNAGKLSRSSDLEYINSFVPLSVRVTKSKTCSPNLDKIDFDTMQEEELATTTDHQVPQVTSAEVSNHNIDDLEERGIDFTQSAFYSDKSFDCSSPVPTEYDDSYCDFQTLKHPVDLPNLKQLIINQEKKNRECENDEILKNYQDQPNPATIQHSNDDSGDSSHQGSMQENVQEVDKQDESPESTPETDEEEIADKNISILSDNNSKESSSLTDEEDTEDDRQEVDEIISISSESDSKPSSPLTTEIDVYDQETVLLSDGSSDHENTLRIKNNIASMSANAKSRNKSSLNVIEISSDDSSRETFPQTEKKKKKSEIRYFQVVNRRNRGKITSTSTFVDCGKFYRKIDEKENYNDKRKSHEKRYFQKARKYDKTPVTVDIDSRDISFETDADEGKKVRNNVQESFEKRHFKEISTAKKNENASMSAYNRQQPASKRYFEMVNKKKDNDVVFISDDESDETNDSPKSSPRRYLRVVNNGKYDRITSVSADDDSQEVSLKIDNEEIDESNKQPFVQRHFQMVNNIKDDEIVSAPSQSDKEKIEDKNVADDIKKSSDQTLIRMLENIKDSKIASMSVDDGNRKVSSQSDEDKIDNNQSAKNSTHNYAEGEDESSVKDKSEISKPSVSGSSLQIKHDKSAKPSEDTQDSVSASEDYWCKCNFSQKKEHKTCPEISKNMELQNYFFDNKE